MGKITNARILAVDAAQVTFRYRDARRGDRHLVMRLDGVEFVRRFLLHILPKGLMRIRHFGFLANRCRREKLAAIRKALTIDRGMPARIVATAITVMPDLPLSTLPAGAFARHCSTAATAPLGARTATIMLTH